MKCDPDDNHYNDYAEERWEQRFGHLAIRCKHCGTICGRIIPAKISGPPENCYPEESDGDYLEGKKDDPYCSQECLDAEESEEPEE